MTKKIRTRFAPSPTGFLHIGGLRTALFNYLVSKRDGGKTLLRIEDTDQKREVVGAVKSLEEVLNWSGIKFDEGPNQGGEYGPYIQSQRLDVYEKYINKLLDSQKAYYCFCSSDRLAELRDEQRQKNQPPRYDRKCRDLNIQEVNKKLEQEEPYVIRQKIPLEGEILVKDLLRGEIKFKAKDLEDHVLIKSDKTPTYQFASVVDDHLMEISHVIRGEEWLPSFPKNVLLYQAFDWITPEFIHLPLILDKEGGKLSKRKNNVAVEDYKKQGYLPEALINFVALLGWHPKDDNEILSLEEIREKFRADDIGISPATFDLDKLNYLNGYYIRQTSLSSLTDKCLPFLEKNMEKSSRNHKKERKFLEKVVAMEQERMKKLEDIADLTEFLFLDDLSYEKDLLVWKKMSEEEVAENLKTIYQILEKIPEKDWSIKTLEKHIFDYIKERGEKVGNFLWPLRVALTGQEKSPGPLEVADALEKKESLARIESALNLIQN